MRAVLQRVSQARVTVAGRTTGEIGRGVLVLVAFALTDNAAVVDWLAEKLVTLRIFNDEAGKMNVDLAAVGGSALIVSQFTLYGDAAKGRRPSFIDAARPEVAEPLYQALLTAVAAQGVPVAAGEFGADMQVSLVNDGPVTILLERGAA